MTTTTPSTDLRVVKTIRAIKQALCSIILKTPYKRIRVDMVTKEALINRQTFYRHFSSIDDVFDSIETDMIREMEDSLSDVVSGNLRGGVEVFYHYISADDPVRRKLFFDSGYAFFFRKLSMDYFALDFFMDFGKAKSHRELIPSFVASVATGVYRCGIKDGVSDLRSLSDEAADLLLHGLKGGKRTI
ncbi:MAG: TetR/AcrR family transcriptional regulator [Lachnospiraceae bacterium]|nr:TetR/AcrR family transcriptional regulator [Lachnospiraceae bacterium]